MHLYSEAIASITWAEIERFCQQGIPENTYVEYKSDFPKDLAKPIAAMANTLGGLILIGIDETDTGTPQLPLKGIDAHRGLEERVLNTILDTMSPPVIPEIATCLSSGGDRAIVVIRVPQSDHAPHALHSTRPCILEQANVTSLKISQVLSALIGCVADARKRTTCASGSSSVRACDSETCVMATWEVSPALTKVGGLQPRSNRAYLRLHCVRSTLIEFSCNRQSLTQLDAKCGYAIIWEQVTNFRSKSRAVFRGWLRTGSSCTSPEKAG